jgi:hypothetical protein
MITQINEWIMVRQIENCKAETAERIYRKRLESRDFRVETRTPNGQHEMKFV